MQVRPVLSILLVSVGALTEPVFAFAEPAFEVASVKATITPGPEDISLNPGTLTIRNISLRRLISWAWDTPRAQISGPDWLTDEHFDISAKASDASAIDEMRLMMRTLLAERMGVRIHGETRELPVYYLTLAKNGPRLHRATEKGPTQFAESVGEGLAHFGRNKMLMVADHISMADLAEQLSDPLQRPVIDRTGLKGRYDIRLDPTAYMVSAEGDAPRERIDPLSMILTAIPLQLGLKVDAGKDTVRFRVVDAANRTPSSN
jgi:uncharacterized protein (TIGR03435 family)